MNGTAILLNQLLLNTVSQKDDKPHTARLDDTIIPHVTIYLNTARKKAQYRSTVKPPSTSEKACSSASNGRDTTFRCLVMYKIN